jgi:transporter family-2 protein
MGIYLLLPFSLLIGLSLASQVGINAQLRSGLNNPIQAAFVSFLVGTIILGVITLFQGDKWLQPGALKSIPWWAWCGGVLGAFNVAMMLFLAPKLGALLLAISIMCGQLLTSLVLDQNGWLGYPKIDISALRATGAVLVIIGMFLVIKR